MNQHCKREATPSIWDISTGHLLLVISRACACDWANFGRSAHRYLVRHDLLSRREILGNYSRDSHSSYYGHRPQQLLILPCKFLQQHETDQIHNSFFNNFSLYHAQFYGNMNCSDRWNFLQKLLSTLYGTSRLQRQPKCTTFPFSNFIDGPYFFSYNIDIVGFIFVIW